MVVPDLLWPDTVGQEPFAGLSSSRPLRTLLIYIIMSLSDGINMQLRTQIYLEPSQHAALLNEARRLRLSLAGMIRKLVEDHVLNKGEGRLSRQEQKKAALSLISLGKSGFSDVSEKTDAYLGKAIHAEMVKEKRAPYNKRPVKRTK